ncbi:hypothetical protein Droror1_Dr00006995 [Drosera rotundifolia]
MKQIKSKYSSPWNSKFNKSSSLTRGHATTISECADLQNLMNEATIFAAIRELKEIKAWTKQVIFTKPTLTSSIFSKSPAFNKRPATPKDKNQSLSSITYEDKRSRCINNLPKICNRKHEHHACILVTFHRRSSAADKISCKGQNGSNQTWNRTAAKKASSETIYTRDYKTKNSPAA